MILACSWVLQKLGEALIECLDVILIRPLMATIG